jgi:hypothetical protein
MRKSPAIDRAALDALGDPAVDRTYTYDANWPFADADIVTPTPTLRVGAADSATNGDDFGSALGRVCGSKRWSGLDAFAITHGW